MEFYIKKAIDGNWVLIGKRGEVVEIIGWGNDYSIIRGLFLGYTRHHYMYNLGMDGTNNYVLGGPHWRMLFGEK
jgi:hypothetical protein